MKIVVKKVVFETLLQNSYKSKIGKKMIFEIVPSIPLETTEIMAISMYRKMPSKVSMLSFG